MVCVMEFNRPCHPYDSLLVLTPNSCGVFVDPGAFDDQRVVHDYWISGSIFKMRDLGRRLVEFGGFEKHQRGEGPMHQSFYEAGSFIRAAKLQGRLTRVASAHLGPILIKMNKMSIEHERGETEEGGQRWSEFKSEIRHGWYVLNC